MGVGKYSPTVSSSYFLDQNWWERNGGGYGNGNNPDSDLDNDGFDSYGYSGSFGDGVDRAGHTEEEYLTCGEWYTDSDDEEQYHYPLYDDVSSDWSGKLLGDLPKFTQVKYKTIYLEFIKFGGVRHLFRGCTLFVHEDDMSKFRETNAKWLD